MRPGASLLVTPRARGGTTLLLLLALAGCGPATVTPDGGADVDAGTFVPVRIATFNARLFFDTVCQSGQCAPADFEQALSPTAFDRKATQVANVVRGLDADVVVLQELENQACLDALVTRVRDVFPSAVLGEIGGDGTVDVAVLARGAITSSTGHRATSALFRPDGTRTLFSRELLEVAVTHQGAPVTVFGAHFRSKVMDDPGRRLAEAQVSRELVQAAAARAPGTLVVLAGDLNDTPGSAPLVALEGNGGLRRVAAELPVAQQATYVFSGREEAIDHLLEGSTPSRYLAGSAVVSRLAAGDSGSDHWPLRASFLALVP